MPHERVSSTEKMKPGKDHVPEPGPDGVESARNKLGVPPSEACPPATATTGQICGGRCILSVAQNATTTQCTPPFCRHTEFQSLTPTQELLHAIGLAFWYVFTLCAYFIPKLN